LNGFSAFSIQKDIEAIKILLGSTNCAITATGVKNCISQHLSLSHFHTVEYLVNMGTHDEWGPSFPKDRILFNKRPLNFMLDYPTKVCYLDPIFAVLACATIDIMDYEQAQQFIIKKPNTATEKKVLNTWLENNHLHQNMKEKWLTELGSLA
jgi:hypothetical protein